MIFINLIDVRVRTLINVVIIDARQSRRQHPHRLAVPHPEVEGAQQRGWQQTPTEAHGVARLFTSINQGHAWT